MKKILYYLLSISPIPAMVYVVVRIPFPSPIVTAILRYYFVEKLKVNLAEAELPLQAYRTILQFFTRRLKPNARKIVVNPKEILSPVDAHIMNHGEIKGNQMVQIKDTYYSLRQLVGSDIAKDYDGGKYITLYLSPRDYHRIHHPVGGAIKRIRFFQGRILPVNPFSLEHFKEVFSRNRRLLLSYEDKQQEKTIKVLSCWVGALNVGQMKIFFDEDFYHKAHRVKIDTREVQEMDMDFAVEQGSEAGAFELGSTVILIFPPGQVEWRSVVADGKFVQVGEVLARII